MFLSRTTILVIKVVGPSNINFNLGIVFGITETFEAHHETDCSSVDALFLDYCAYRISSNKTRGYFFFTRPSSAGIIRMRVLFKGGSYMRKYGSSNSSSFTF